MSTSDSCPTGPSSSLLTSVLDSGESSSIQGEDQFHRAFGRVCIEMRERDPERLLSKFLRHHDQIMVFAGALDESTSAELFPRPSSIFWSVALRTVQAAMVSQQKDILFLRYFPKLAPLLPAFGADLHIHPHHEIVQGPLRQMFERYIQCYKLVLGHIESSRAAEKYDEFLQYIRATSLTMSELKNTWERAVKDISSQVAANAQHASGSPDGLSPYTTNISFERLETLGHGTYGHVFKVREMSTGTFYAQKVIRVTNPGTRAQVKREVANEVAAMQKLRHHHIATIHLPVQEHDLFSIIMEPVADCDLRGFLKSRCIDAGFPRAELRHLTSWFGCLVSAMAFAHGNEIKHGDIKPSNILIKDCQPYLADFGCAKDFSGQDSSTSEENTRFGTPVYWAPRNQTEGRSADVFSLGCVFTEMLTVRSHRTLEDFQRFRRTPQHDNPYAFRTSLAQVLKWMDMLVDSPTDSVGALLKEQTMNMIEPEAGKRKDARYIKKALRAEAEDVMCSNCS